MYVEPRKMVQMNRFAGTHRSFQYLASYEVVVYMAQAKLWKLTLSTQLILELLV